MRDEEQKLLEVVNEISTSTRSERVRQLAKHIRDADACTISTALSGWGNSPIAKKRVQDLVTAWKSSRVSAAELAGMLTAASFVVHRSATKLSLELVWTGPSSKFVPTRKTEQVLLEVIRAAKSELFLTSFVAYDVPSILEALDRAINAKIKVSVLLESSKEYGGELSIDSIGKMHEALPGAEVYYWRKDKGDSSAAKVHAKIAVADNSACFISSANLTGHAMEKNMEAGVLLRGGSIPGELHKHLKALAMIGVIQKASL